jgi:hypothetical protein
MALTIKSTICWDVAPCSPVEFHRRFGGTCSLSLKILRVSHASNQQEAIRN